MSEAKSFASLSSGLLARKGTARPAMRPQGFGQFNSSMEDLGWNDMGHLPESPPQPVFAPHREDRVTSAILPLTPVSVEEEAEDAFEPSLPIVEQQRAAIEASFGDTSGDRTVLATKAKKPALEHDDFEEEQEDAEAAEAFQEAEAVETVEAVEVDDHVEAVEVAEPVPAFEIQRKPEPKAAAKAKAAFTLRLEADRHLKLRLACAVTGRSAQQLVTEALDLLLKSKPEIEALAGHLPGKSH